MKTNEYLKIQKHLDLLWDGFIINMYSRDKSHVIFIYTDGSFGFRNATKNVHGIQTSSLRVLLKLARLNGI